MSCETEIYGVFKGIQQKDESISVPVATLLSLSIIAENSTATTVTEITNIIKQSAESLKKSCRNHIAVTAGIDHFIHYSNKVDDAENIQSYKQNLSQIGPRLLSLSIPRKATILNNATKFITDDSVILLHSYSRIVMNLLLNVHKEGNVRFSVFCTESREGEVGGSGKKIITELKSAGIPATLILDASVGYFIGKIDMVLVGAEGITENGGLINQMGTYQVALLAKAAHKPFYVITESSKFVRLFPLNQYSLTSSDGMTGLEGCGGELNRIHVDYTPPEYISLLFTDLGVLTPFAAADELLKFYQ